MGQGRLGSGGTSVAVCSEVSRRDQRQEASPLSRQAPLPQSLSSVSPLFSRPLCLCSPRHCCCRPFSLPPSLISHLARPIPDASPPFPLPPVILMTEGYLSNKVNRVRAIFQVKPVTVGGYLRSVLQLTRYLSKTCSQSTFTAPGGLILPPISQVGKLRLGEVAHNP